MTVPSHLVDPVPMKEAREICRDLFAPNAGLYWIDAMGSAVVGWTAFVFALTVPMWSPAYLALTLVATLTLYRAILFVHELTHLAKGALPGFNVAWDLVVGIPLALPSFMYHGTHLDHHRRTIYGTIHDPEYVPYGVPPRTKIIRALIEPFIAPVALFARFLVLAPLSVLLGSRFRAMIVSSASTLAINLAYRRDPPKDSLRIRWIWTETLASLVAIALVASVAFDRLPIQVLIQWYIVSACVAHVNNLRTLAAHRYRNAGAEMDVQGQLADSVNTPGAWWTELWAPVGLRWHGLHHFLPDVPYHNLGKAHRRLIAALPASTVYRRTLSPSLWASLADVWRSAGGAPNRG